MTVTLERTKTKSTTPPPRRNSRLQFVRNMCEEQDKALSALPKKRRAMSTEGLAIVPTPHMYPALQLEQTRSPAWLKVPSRHGNRVLENEPTGQV